MPEGGDAIVVFSGSDRRRQGVGDARQPLKVIMCHDILEPEEVIWLDAAADLDRLIDVPELVDVAHEIDVVANALAQHPDALDLACHRRLGAKLCLHLLEAYVHQPRSSFCQVIDRKWTHQCAAGICGNTIATAAE